MAVYYGYRNFYSYQGPGAIQLKVIDTHASNIRSETILRPISHTSYMGVNGGFFDAANGYNNPPTGGSSIAYWYEDTGSICYSGTCHKKIFENNENSQNNLVNRKTAIIYKDYTEKNTMPKNC